MPRRHLTFRQLETFATVARLGSFSRAAEALHLTQPAVSIQVRQITESVGLPLFEQSGREIRLTAAGQELLRTARELDDSWNRFESAVDALKGLKKGRLRVALVTTAKYFLPRMLGAFCQRYPDIEIELEVANRARIIERLRANEDDLYIMSFPPEELDVVATPFLDNPLVVVAPAAYPLPAGPLSLADLAPHPFLLRETGSGTRKAVDRHLAANGLTLKVKLALGSNEAIRDLVASGMGLAILSRHVLGEHPEQEGLRILEVAGFPLQQPWSVVHLRQKILSLPAHAFMNELLPAVRMAADTP
ncbi:MAG: LysR family transcriptional regulator [Rhodocyclaceae bacterium]|nr:LysR family transcriptional regulator [Rhodocyclaceae bacterium]HRF31317.1 LysR family transcriptional regulator [Azonexus sp.]